MPLYHLVGALDPLTAADVKTPVSDGLPETLASWIPFNGLTHLKIKLNGDDLGWDVDRVVGVDRVAEEEQARRGVATWHYSLDFNEKCGNVGYLLEFLRQVKDRAPRGFDRIQYIEQPTRRDLKADRANVMHEASKLRPVVIDESLIDLESLRLAKEMGYTGRSPESVQGPDPVAAVGGGRDQGWDVLVRSGPIVSRRISDSLGRVGRAHSGRGGNRSEFTAILPSGQYSLGVAVSWHVSDYRRDNGNGIAGRAGTRGGTVIFRLRVLHLSRSHPKVSP